MQKLYKSKEISCYRVEVTFYDQCREKWMEPEIYHSPCSGGYVIYGKNNSQICERMSTKGITLLWNGKGSLIELIRKELKKWAKEQKKYGPS